MKIKATLYIALILGILTGCQKSNEAYIEDELKEYFSRFENEAHTRGIKINLDEIDLSGYIEEISERGVLGTCTTFTNGAQSVIIDQPYWNSSTDLQKEYLVFHELGHCVLKRAHDNSRYTNGTCKSIMQSGTGGCRSVYSDNTKDQLIDELFDNF